MARMTNSARVMMKSRPPIRYNAQPEMIKEGTGSAEMASSRVGGNGDDGPGSVEGGSVAATAVGSVAGVRSSRASAVGDGVGVGVSSGGVVVAGNMVVKAPTALQILSELALTALTFQ